MNEEQLNKYRELVLAIADAERRIASYKDAARISAELEADARERGNNSTGGLTTSQGQAKWEQEQRDIKAGQQITTLSRNTAGDMAKSSGFDFDFIFNPLRGLMGMLGELASSFSSVMAIVNWGQTILEGAMSILAPLVDSVLAPVVGALKIIGELIGKMLAPIISALGPAISTLATVFVWLYNNVLIPLGNVFIYVGNIFYNVAVAIHNVIDWLFNWSKSQIGYIDLNSGMLTPISENDLSTAGTSKSGSSGGGSTTYSKPRDITINVNVYTPALVGEGGFRQFALTMNKELKLALASGAT